MRLGVRRRAPALGAGSLRTVDATNRWVIYQRERFPVFAHGVLIAAFSSSAMCFSALLRGMTHVPAPGLLAAGFASSFLFFLLLRIADEFKDFADDSAYRPYRPVQRGVVTLKQLAVLGVIAVLLQVGIALLVKPALALLLVGVWAYFGLMSKEFFVSKWLRAHPVAYLLSHMFIMPLIDLYVTAFDWLVAGTGPPLGLSWFLVVSFLNGIVIEVGRKVRAPQDEERGVETYSALWGTRRSAVIWLSALALTAVVALGAARQIGFLTTAGELLGSLVVAAVVIVWVFLATTASAAAKRIEAMAGFWTVGMYLTLGVIPMLARVVAHVDGR